MHFFIIHADFAHLEKLDAKINNQEPGPVRRYTSTMPAAENYHYFDFAYEKKKKGINRELGMSYCGTLALLDKIPEQHANKLNFAQLQINSMAWNDPNFNVHLQYEIPSNNPLEEAHKEMLDYNPDASITSWIFPHSASLNNVQVVQRGINTMKQLIDNEATFKNFKPFYLEERLP